MPPRNINSHRGFPTNCRLPRRGWLASDSVSLWNRANSVHELLRPLSASSGFSSNLKCIPLWQTGLCHGFHRLRSDVAGIARGTASRNRVARQEITRPRYRPLFSSNGSAVCTVRRRNVLFSYRYRAESRGHRAILSHDRVHRATFAVNLATFPLRRTLATRVHEEIALCRAECRARSRPRCYNPGTRTCMYSSGDYRRCND